MAKTMARNRRPEARPTCTDAGTSELTAALDRHDAAAAVAVLAARPMPPNCIEPRRVMRDWFGVFALADPATGDQAILLQLAGLDASFAGSTGCPTCRAFFRAFHDHPLLAADGPERRQFVAAFDQAAAAVPPGWSAIHRAARAAR